MAHASGWESLPHRKRRDGPLPVATLFPQARSPPHPPRPRQVPPSNIPAALSPGWSPDLAEQGSLAAMLGCLGNWQPPSWVARVTS